MGNSFLCPVQTDVDWLRLAPQSLSFDSRFDVDEDNVLGTGKFSTVYMCTYRENPDQRYALKAISTYTGDKASYSRIVEEIAIMKAINQHSSIIRLIDMDESTPNTIRLVLELCEGGELYDRIQQKRFYSEADTKLLVKNLLEAVEFIHSKGIMHRDLKPENILLVSKVSNTDIKVSDFGLAKLSRDFPRRLPRSTSICGSDFYLAPEVIKQEEYGREIDIWAVGVITFVVLSGALPFFNPVLHKLYRQIVERDVSFADDRWRAVSAGAQVGRKWRECSMAVWSLAHATQNLVQTALEEFAASLEDRSEQGGTDPSEIDAAPMLFPMYTVSVDTVLQMTQVMPHEDLKDKGMVVEFHLGMGDAAFISHQWVSNQHPDPDFMQFLVLQGALRRMLFQSHHLPTDVMTEVYLPRRKAFDTAQFRQAHLYLWYDYFSCPQLEQLISPTTPAAGPSSPLSKAIDSIPTYIARCKFFFALCPVVESLRTDRVFSPFSWSERGWCRVERAFRELSPDQSWIMIKSSTEMELVSSVLLGLGRAAGEGQFTVAEDRVKLGSVLQGALRRKLMLLLLLKAQDLVGYRVLMNMQRIHLRGFPLEARYDLLLPGPGPEDHELQVAARSVQHFLYQNGFRSIHEVDGSGWAPVHYAAMRGDPDVMHGLLEMRANIDRWTKKDQPQSGMLLGMTPLQICGFFKHYPVMRLLISANARVDSGLHPDMPVQCLSDDPAGIRILCKAGCELFRRNFLGMNAFDTASSIGALAALEELVTQAGEDLTHADLSKALCMAAAFKGGRAELIQRLLDLRAPVDGAAAKVATTIPARVLLTAKALQHKYGKETPLSRFCYHTGGQTPLMAAIMSAQYEGAAALIASGARLDLRNSRGWTAADFAAGHLLPDFLREAFQGCMDSSQRVADVALANASLAM
ncbi:mlkA [Symbiodinium microadriaticum]|nr:mlkA [Symbiodinium microadriaticum]